MSTGQKLLNLKGTQMPSVEIQYCVPCGHLDRAIDTQRHLLEEFGQGLEGVRLKTGEGGVFTVDVDGERVFDKKQGSYDLDSITSAVGEFVTN
jgi:selenoprotein W-related protein